MEKLAAGPKAAKAIDLDAPVDFNIRKVANALQKEVSDITVMVLDRDRHDDLIKKIRQAGARVRLITDGDVAGAIAPSLPDSGIDLLMGVGKSTEAVLAAVAVKILGGQILARFKPKDKEEEEALKKIGIKDPKKVHRAEDLAKGDMLTFTATGIIDGPFLPGVEFPAQGGSASGGTTHRIITHSVVMRASSGTIRYITTHHHQRQLK